MIFIEYHGKKVLAEVIGDHKVRLLRLNDIELDQCRRCGVWASEDEEMYGDGFCTHCCEMCQDCMLYHRIENIVTTKDGMFCKACHQTHETFVPSKKK